MESHCLQKRVKYIKSDEIPYIIYADIESLILKKYRCENDPEKSSTTNIGEHIPCGYSVSIILGIWSHRR